jgi:hypothetical protein
LLEWKTAISLDFQTFSGQERRGVGEWSEEKVKQNEKGCGVSVLTLEAKISHGKG